MRKKEFFTITVEPETIIEFKNLCNKHYVSYSKMISNLMLYAISKDKTSNIIDCINQELIQ